MIKQKIGSWLQLGSTKVFEILQKYDFDFHVIDLEHGSHNDLEIFPSVNKTKKKLFVRVSSRDSKFYSWLLDIGYDGIILSDVRSTDEIDSLISGSFFRPIGSRGIGYCSKNNFGKDMEPFLKNKMKPIIGIQIESLEGLSVLEKHSNKYKNTIDFYILGPYDISSSIGKPGEFNSLEYLNVVERFNKIIEKNDLQKGTHVVNTSQKDLQKARSDNYNYIAFSTDGKILIDSLENINL